MGKLIPILAAVFAASLAAGGVASADDATEGRLRDALRQALAQQRALEDSQAQLQARVSDQDKQIQAQQAQLVRQTPAPAAQPDRAAIERVEVEANRRLAAQNEALTKAGETLEKWKAAYEQATSLARAKEAERVRLAAAVAGLETQGQACVAKNQALLQAGSEILDHLKNISVAEALAAHEPFVGTKRVELQSLAQDDEDKLLNQKVDATPIAGR